MRYAFIRAHQERFHIASLCRVLRVSKSGYYEWPDRGPSARAQANAQLLDEIRRVHETHFQAYGALKTWRALKAQGIACGKHRVARLRGEQGIEAKRTQRFRVMIEHHHTAAPVPDLIASASNSPIGPGWAI